MYPVLQNLYHLVKTCIITLKILDKCALATYNLLNKIVMLKEITMLLKLKSFLAILWDSMIEAQQKRAEYYKKTRKFME